MTRHYDEIVYAKIRFRVFKEDFANEDNSELNKSFLKVGKLVDPKLATPHCYMSMINTYAKIYAGKRSAITERQSKLQVSMPGEKIVKINKFQNFLQIFGICINIIEVDLCGAFSRCQKSQKIATF